MPDRKHVVVINDTEEILALFREIIEGEMGHRVSVMSYAPQEAAEIANLRPDLVIIDFVLGGREFQGWQLMQKLRMRRDTEKLPIIAVTGAVNEIREMEGHLMQLRIKTLFKPFTIDQLENVVAEALESG